MYGSDAEPDLQIDAGTLDTMRRSGDGYAILDVREPSEIAICAFDESLNVPLGELTARTDELPSDTPLVVVCHHGIRSLQAVMWLRDQGFSRAVTLAGGIDAWARDIDRDMPRY